MEPKNFWQAFRWQSNGFLFLPTQPRIPERRTLLRKVLHDTTGVAITHKEIFGKDITPDELTQLIKSISCTTWLLILAKISSAFVNSKSHAPELQTSLARMIFPKDILGKIEKLTKGDYNGVPLNNWQIAMIAKIALLESELQTQEPNGLIDQRAIGRCLLGVNDYISSTDFKSGPPHSGKEYQPLLESIIRVLSFQLSENPKHVLSRYYDLLIKLPSTPQATSIKNHLLITDLFESLLKFPLALFLTLGFSVFAQYETAWKDNKLPSNDNIIINRDKYFGNTNISKDKCDRFLDFITINKTDFIRQYRQKYPDDFGLLNDFNILRNRPLISISDHQAVSINLQWLYQKIGEGVFWEISDRLGEDNNKPFRTFFGELYQLYFTNIFQRMYPTGILQQRAFYDIKYDKDKRSSDAILYYPNTLVFVEAKWPTLRMEQTTIPGNLDAFNLDCDNIIVEAAKQLDRNIHDFEKGILPLNGVNPKDIHTYYPVVVTARPFPLGLLVTSHILERVRKAGFLSSRGIRTLEIISIEELEYLEPLITGGKTFPQIIDRKQSLAYYKDLPMKWHIFKNEITGSKVPRNEYIDSIFTELTDKIRDGLF